MKRAVAWTRVAALLALLGASASAEAQSARYYHLDALGSVRALTDASGAVLERHDYLPFGEECTTGPCALNPGVGEGGPRKFTGKERDTETGLDYFGARYYGSRIGRFTTIDPVYTWQENLADPQRWNRYAYVRNSPLRYVDPDGRVILLPPIGVSWSKAQFDQRLDLTIGLVSGVLEAVLPGLEIQANNDNQAIGQAIGQLGAIGALSAGASKVGGSQSARPVGAEPPPFIYRAGGSNPGNLTPRLGEEALSFRDSLSNPFPLTHGQRPVFGPGQPYIKVDTSKLPPGSVRPDNVPPGHVSVKGPSPAQLKDAVVEKGKLP